MATVGKAVAISGVAVAIGLSSLTVFESPSLRSMGIGGVVTVLSTLIFGLTVLPAVLGMLGPRVNRWRVPLPRSLRLVEDDPAAADARQGHGFWGRFALAVMRRPVLVAAPVLVMLIVAGLPFFGIQLSTGGNLDDLPPSTSVDGFHVLADEFPGGDADPIGVAVLAEEPFLTDGALPPSWVQSLQAYVADLKDLDLVTEITSVLEPPAGMDEATYLQLISVPESQRPPEAAGIAIWIDQWVADDVTRVNVFNSALPDSAEARALIDQVRALPVPDGATDTLTAGLSSRSRDFMASFTNSVPVRACHRHRRDPHRPVPDLRVGPAADQGRAHEPVEHHGQLRRAGLDLPGRAPVRAAQLRSLRHHHRVDADPDVRDPVRALDGLRGVPALADPRAVPGDAATTRARSPRGSE